MYSSVLKRDGQILAINVSTPSTRLSFEFKHYIYTVKRVLLLFKVTSGDLMATTLPLIFLASSVANRENRLHDERKQYGGKPPKSLVFFNANHKINGKDGMP